MPRRLSGSLLAQLVEQGLRAPGSSPRPRLRQLQAPFGCAALVISPAAASLEQLLEAVGDGGLAPGWPKLATTSSRSVTSTVSPAFARRTYSDSRALSCLIPTTFMGAW
jgi:hypothetical protein